MKQQHWVVVGFIFLILGIGVSVYLVSHHYDLMYARQESKSFCSVNAAFDCDAVNTSVYSEVAGIPVSLIAALAFLVELLLLLGYRAFGEDEKKKLARFYFYLTVGNVVVSIALAIVSSFILKTYCLMCLTLYVVSLATFITGWKLVGEQKFSLLASDIASLFKSGSSGGARGILILLLLVPVGGVLANAMYRESMAGEIDKVVAQSIMDWKANKPFTFAFGHPHEEGNPSASFQIVEFSDFQCPHCKRAAPSIHAFINAHKQDVHFVFQNYPLDKSCNNKMKTELHDKACLMARVALCSQEQNKFSEAHDWIFAHQDDLNADSVKTMAGELNLDEKALQSCVQDNKNIQDEVLRELDQGNLAGVEGTPTVFVNGRALPAGFLIPVLEAAFNSK